MAEETKKEQESIKEDKKSSITIIIIILILLVAIGLVGWNISKSLSNKEEPIKEKVDNQKEEQEPVNDNEKYIERAKELIDFGYYGRSTASKVFSNKSLSFASLSNSEKLLLSLKELSNTKNIPICSNEDPILVTRDEIKKVSPFENTDFVDGIFDKKLASSDDEYIVGTFVLSNQDGDVYILDSNCDGEGPGIHDWYETNIKDIKVVNDKITITLEFAFFYIDKIDDKEIIHYLIKDTYEKSGKTIVKKNVSMNKSISISDLKDTKLPQYEITLKIKDDEVYFLTAKKLK